MSVARIISLTLWCASVLSAVSWAAADEQAYGTLRIERGLDAGRVYQRSEHGTATFDITGWVRPREAVTLRYRVMREGQGVGGFDWQPIAVTEDGRWRLHVEGLFTGGPFRFEFQLTDAGGRLLDERHVANVFVGDLWVLAGQSNMDGCGPLEDAPPPSPMVRCFSLANDWRLAEDPMHWAAEGAYPVYRTSYVSPTERRAIPHEPRGPWPEWKRPRNEGAGLGIPFAKRITEETGVPIGLVLCSLGGTTMAQWSPELKEQGGASLYGAMLDRVAKVGGRVAGVLWYQGESDSYPASVSRQYGERLAHLIASIRADFGQPDLPFYVVQLGPQVVSGAADPVGRNLVREAQRRAAQDLANVGLVTAIDQRLSSSAHLDTPGYIRVGERLANLVLRDRFGRDIQPGPRLSAVQAVAGEPNKIRVTFDQINGRLRAPGRVRGFSIRQSDGQIAVNILRTDLVSPDAVMIEAIAPVPEGSELWYGYGWTPDCNLVDERDMAAPAFGPVAITPGTAAMAH